MPSHDPLRPGLILFGPEFAKRARLADAQAKQLPPIRTRVQIALALALIGAWAIGSSAFCALMGRIETLGYDVSDDPVYVLGRNMPPLRHLSELADRLDSVMAGRAGTALGALFRPWLVRSTPTPAPCCAFRPGTLSMQTSLLPHAPSLDEPLDMLHAPP